MTETWKSVSEPYWDNGQIKIDCVAQDLPPSNATPRYYGRLYCKGLHITSKKLLDEDGDIIKPERSCTLELSDAAVEAWCSPLPFDTQVELHAYWTVKDSVTRTIPEKPVAHDTALSIAITDEVGNPITESVVGETVYIVGQLRDIVDNVALQGASIALYKNGVATGKTDVTDASGVYSIPYTITKADVGILKFKTYFAGT